MTNVSDGFTRALSKQASDMQHEEALGGAVNCFDREKVTLNCLCGRVVSRSKVTSSDYSHKQNYRPAASR